MTAWTWKTLEPIKAEVGDTIGEEREIIYIKGVRNLGKGLFSATEITPEVHLTLGEYSHQFHWKDEPGAGYSFPCKEDGSLPDANFVYFNNQTAQEYFDSVKATPDLIYDGIEYSERVVKFPKVIRCYCGEPVALHMVMTNTCDKCDRDYNVSGQLLAPRSEWGWDTGESLSDILSSDWSINDPTPGREDYDD